MQIISFENDLDSLRLAFRHREKFTYLRHAGPAALLEKGEWQSRRYAGLSWQLIAGDFLKTMTEAPFPPDLIFYDMFSSKTCGDQWTMATFRQLFTACHGRAAELFTYTISTAARVAMLAAGFYVAKGRSTGPKVETTIALTPKAVRSGGENPHDLLSTDWLEKWTRSRAKYPPEIGTHEHPSFEKMILEHGQFQSTIPRQ